MSELDRGARFTQDQIRGLVGSQPGETLDLSREQLMQGSLMPGQTLEPSYMPFLQRLAGDPSIYGVAFLRVPSSGEVAVDVVGFDLTSEINSRISDACDDLARALGHREVRRCFIGLGDQVLNPQVTTRLIDEWKDERLELLRLARFQ